MDKSDKNKISLPGLLEGLLYIICNKLDSTEVIELIKTTHIFSSLNFDKFWGYYSLSLGYNIWDPSVVLKRIIFANFWYKKRCRDHSGIQKAAFPYHYSFYGEYFVSLSHYSFMASLNRWSGTDKR